MKRQGPRFNQNKSDAAIYIYPCDESSAETVELDAIGGVEDQILCEQNHSFVTINNSDVNPDIDTDANKANDDENEEYDDKYDVTNNASTLDDEDGGIITNDGPI